MKDPGKLHIGSGDVSLPGWYNIDITPYPNVDLVADVTKPLPFQDVEFLFAEHFLEHLEFGDALRFLRECRRILAPEGILRLSTPNLDWVWRTQYRPGEASIADCFHLNRAFYGWGHRFLYNETTLRAALDDAGFAQVTSCEYGESAHPELRSLERHDRDDDSPDLPHVLIVEATGRREPEDSLGALVFEYQRATHAPWHLLQYAALSTTRLAHRLLSRLGLR